MVGKARAVKDADVVQTQKAARKDVVSVLVGAVDPPGEIEQQFVETTLEKGPVAPPGGSIDAQHGPGMDRRINVAEVELVGWNGTARVHIPLAQHEH